MNVVWNSLLRFIITDELKFHEFVSITCLSCTYKYWSLVSKLKRKLLKVFLVI